jgi:hypothetical protein
MRRDVCPVVALLLSSLLLIGGFVVADVVEARITSASIEPSMPSVQDSVTLHMRGYLPNGCWYLLGSHVSRAGNAFRFHVCAGDSGYPGAVCPLLTLPYCFRKNVGTLESGTYDVTFIEAQCGWPGLCVVRDSLCVQFTVGTSDVADDLDGRKVDHFELSQNHPNPFNTQTVIDYFLPRSAYVRLAVYDLPGRKVKVLVEVHQSRGGKTVHWDGRDQRGDEVATGTYFYRLELGDFAETRKMILVK